MALDLNPDSLACSECIGPLDDTGYLPATETSDGYDPHPAAAVCGACGFNDIGMMGCAPELDEIVDPGVNDVLLHVRPTDEGYEVLSEKS